MRYNPYFMHVKSVHELQQEFEQIGLPEAKNRLLTLRAQCFFIHLEQVDRETALLLQQEMRSFGGETYFSEEDAYAAGAEPLALILQGSGQQFAELIGFCMNAGADLQVLGKELSALIAHKEAYKSKELVCGPYRLEVGTRTLIMGILNVTPDSFSDGGRWVDVDVAVEHAKQMVADGADILDIGGESTRPGHEVISSAEEIRRVVPVIERLVREVNVPISIDTYKADVAAAALDAGAHIVNDIWGLKADTNMAALCAKRDCPVILMHNRATPLEQDVMTGVVRDLRECLDLALQAGVREENIWLDPGIGFGKTHEQNLLVMKRLADLTSLGYPLLLATSRKSMIGNVLGLPASEREEGTAATVALGITLGAEMVRVHDVKAMTRVARMTDAMVR